LVRLRLIGTAGVPEGWNIIHAIAKSLAGSPAQTSPKSITAETRPSLISTLLG
jgi:hypothetical protein